jgi:hypothetical protein
MGVDVQTDPVDWVGYHLLLFPHTIIIKEFVDMGAIIRGFLACL